MRSGDTPVLIPNTMVKTQTADGTMLETAWESRRLPDPYVGKPTESRKTYRSLKTEYRIKNLKSKVCKANDRDKTSEADFERNLKQARKEKPTISSVTLDTKCC